MDTPVTTTHERELFNTKLEVMQIKMQKEFEDKMRSEKSQIKKQYADKLSAEQSRAENALRQLSEKDNEITTLTAKVDALSKQIEQKDRQIVRQQKLINANS